MRRDMFEETKETNAKGLHVINSPIVDIFIEGFNEKNTKAFEGVFSRPRVDG